MLLDAFDPIFLTILRPRAAVRGHRPCRFGIRRGPENIATQGPPRVDGTCGPPRPGPSARDWSSVVGHDCPQLHILTSPQGARLAIKVLVADADEGYRSRLSRRLGKVPELEVVGQADPGISAFAAAAALEVDVLVLHVELPLDGQLDGIRTLDPSRPRPLILVLGRLGRADTERVEASGADAVVSPAVGSRSLARLITILASQRSSVDPTAPVCGTLWSS